MTIHSLLCPFPELVMGPNDTYSIHKTEQNNLLTPLLSPLIICGWLKCYFS